MHVSVLVTGLTLSSTVLGRTVSSLKAAQLTREDVGDFSGIAFGHVDDRNLVKPDPECRYLPGDQGWPSSSEWSRFNASIDGALLKPEPAAAACYPGPGHDEERCRFLVERAASVRCTYREAFHPISAPTGLHIRSK